MLPELDLPELDLCYADPAQSRIAVREELDDLDHDLPEVWRVTIVLKPHNAEIQWLPQKRCSTTMLLDAPKGVVLR